MFKQQLTLAEAKERDQLLFGDYNPSQYHGGVRDFETPNAISADTMRTLIDKGYADPDDGQNEAPSLDKFIDFCTKHSEFKMGGYAVSRKRSDCGIIVTEIEGSTKDAETLSEFTDLFGYADEFSIDLDGNCWAWFD